MKVGCMGEGVGLGRECMEFVNAGFLFSFLLFFLGDEGPGAPYFFNGTLMQIWKFPYTFEYI